MKRPRPAPCRLCGRARVSRLADFGLQPVGGPLPPGRRERRGPVSLAVCRACGLVQLEDPLPARALPPGAAYREPERHLDALARALLRLPGITRRSSFVGVGPVSAPLLARLERLGAANVRAVDPRRDIGAPPGAGLAALAESLTPRRAAALAGRRGGADVVVALRILEHARRPARFLEALGLLARPDGRVVLEIPDSARALESGDLGAVWEEHALYFTEATLRRAVGVLGMRAERVRRWRYPLEDSLVAIARRGGRPEPPPAPDAELRRARLFAARRFRVRDAVLALLRAERLRRIPLLGAGHRALSFVNLSGLGPRIEFAVDDDPRKEGLRLPGSAARIRGSGALLRGPAGPCLLGVSPDAESRAIARHRAFRERGGRFLSIYPESRRAPAARRTKS